MLDYIRIACGVPEVKVADVPKNTQDICAFMADADANAVDVLVLPELALTGYSCADLFFQDSLWQEVKAGMKAILEHSAQYPDLTVVLGVPVRLGGKLFNCAAVVRNGGLRGIVPKTYLPDYGVFHEKSWFSSADELEPISEVTDVFGLGEFGYTTVGTQQVFPLGDGAVLGVEICEDLLTPVAPSAMLSLSGANVIVNLSASNELVGKDTAIKNTVVHQSGACTCIYAYCSAGYTESTSDLVFSGRSIIAENGRMLQENNRMPDAGYMLVQDCDLGRIINDRIKSTSFRDASARFGDRELYAETAEHLRSDGTLYPLRKLSFVPEDREACEQRCREAFSLQVTGLMQRLKTIQTKAVIGISGGLDSTLALLVAVEAMRRLGRPATDVHCVTMPCFGTSDRTYRNAWDLMQILGVTAREINIRDAVNQHFRDIGHDETVHNGTYENSQARERTQILMDYAGMVGGIVVGTGDLSELALGWCTYNGDHMSMYGVNANVPKTLIPRIIETVAQSPEFAPAEKILRDVLDTPISPELLPPTDGKISQQTEDLVGPYALHDFFLYYMLRFGFTPKKIYTMACRAFTGEYDAETVKKWLKVFYKRFFTQQFKRNCMPDGVKIGSVGVGPRGDWKMPSDASARIWLEEVESL